MNGTDSLMTEFVIKTPRGFVVGYSSHLMIVSTTQTPDFAKKFKTMEKAQQFIDMYGDAGFALNKNTSKIVQYNEE